MKDSEENRTLEVSGLEPAELVVAHRPATPAVPRAQPAVTAPVPHTT